MAGQESKSAGRGQGEDAEWRQGAEEREAGKSGKDRSWVVGRYESGHLLLLGVQPPSLL